MKSFVTDAAAAKLDTTPIEDAAESLVRAYEAWALYHAPPPGTVLRAELDRFAKIWRAAAGPPQPKEK